jgi:membrane protein
MATTTAPPQADEGAAPPGVFAWLKETLMELFIGLRLAGRAMWLGFVGFYNSSDLTFASSIAYYALLSLFPFLLLALSIFASVTASEAQRTTVLNFVFRYFPRQFDFVTGQLEALAATRVSLGLLGSILMIWAALGVFGAITSAVNHAWRVERQPSYFQHKLVSFLMLVAAGAILMTALIIVSLADMLQSSRFAVLLSVPGLAVLRTFTLQHASTALLIFVMGLIYYFVPNTKVRFRDVWLGAIVAGLLWRGVLAGFQWYVRDMTRFSMVHGSIAAVVVFLLWVYVSAVVLLYGAEVTAAFARLRRRYLQDVALGRRTT